jgi:hypothetical protein
MTLPDESRDVNCKSQEIWNWLVHLRSNRVKGSEIEVLKNAKRKKKSTKSATTSNWVWAHVCVRTISGRWLRGAFFS